MKPLAEQQSAAVIPNRVVEGGMPILLHRPDAFDRAPRWSLAPAPVAVAGGSAHPDYDLTYASSVELLSDGRLVTLSRVGNRLFVFAPNGQPEKSLGRQGRGPGDLMAPAGMTRAFGDTIVITDPANNRINWIVASKGFVADRPLPSVPNGAYLKPVGILRGGRLVMFTGGLVQQGLPDTISRPPASIVVVSPRGDDAAMIASVPDLEVVRVPTNFRGRPGSTTAVLRFSRRAMAVAWDTVIATGSGDGYRIDLWSGAGQPRGSIRVPVARRAVTKAMRDSAVAAALRRFDEPQAERMVDAAESRRLEQSTPAADSLPPYSGWFVSPNGTLWVVDAVVPSAAGGAATAFRQDGAIVGRLTWSVSGTPMAFGDDRVVLRSTDADGVVSLRVFRISLRSP